MQLIDLIYQAETELIRARRAYMDGLKGNAAEHLANVSKFIQDDLHGAAPKSFETAKTPHVSAEEAAKAEAERAAIEQPAEPAAEQQVPTKEDENEWEQGYKDQAGKPESKPGAGVVSDPAKSESKPDAGVVSEPEKSQKRPGSGVS